MNTRLPYLEARVGYEPGVVAQVGGVVLHHALGLRLAEVLVGGGEAAGRQHHGGGFWVGWGDKREEFHPVDLQRQEQPFLTLCLRVLPTVASCLKCRQELG